MLYNIALACLLTASHRIDCSPFPSVPLVFLPSSLLPLGGWPDVSSAPQAPIIRRQPCCWRDTPNCQQQVLWAETLANFEISPENCGSPRTLNFDSVCEEPSRSGGWEFSAPRKLRNLRLRTVAVWEVGKRNCLSKHECKFEIAMRMLI